MWNFNMISRFYLRLIQHAVVRTRSGCGIIFGFDRTDFARNSRQLMNFLSKIVPTAYAFV